MLYIWVEHRVVVGQMGQMERVEADKFQALNLRLEGQCDELGSSAIDRGRATLERRVLQSRLEVERLHGAGDERAAITIEGHNRLLERVGGYNSADKAMPNSGRPFAWNQGSLAGAAI